MADAEVFIKSLELSGVSDLEELQANYEFRCGRFAGDTFEGQHSVKKSVFSGKSIKKYVGDPPRLKRVAIFTRSRYALLGHVSGRLVISFFRLLPISADFLRKG